MAVTAEAQTNSIEYFAFLEDQCSNEAVQPIAVTELQSDAQIRQKSVHFIGSVIFGQPKMAEVYTIQQPIESLYEAIQLAAAGNQEAVNLIKTNVRTDVIERTIKTGHVMNKVPLIVNEYGKVLQYGQTIDSVQANSLRYAARNPIMRQRVEAETHNAFRIEDLRRRGYFEDYSFVVLSRAENMPHEGFFTETMSCAIQVTSKYGDGLAVETAFVSGIATPGGPQHDQATIIEMGRRLGVDLRGKTAAEIIDRPILIPNSMLKNGAIDLVKLYDSCAGGTFFGEHRPRHGYDYLDYLAGCAKRELDFKPRVDKIASKLITEATTITGPLAAVRRLHELSEQNMVEHAVLDHSIDLRVFGNAEAIWHIEQARLAIASGDVKALDEHLDIAKDKAETSSCPGETKDAEKQDQDCEFVSKECPVCKRKNVRTKSTKYKISGDCGCVVYKEASSSLYALAA
jgi:hypothetical protein